MKTINDGTFEPENSGATIGSWGEPVKDSDIDSILEQYKSGYTEETSTQQNEPVKPAIDTTDKNDKRFYYVKGAKKGQRKPEAVIKQALKDNPITVNTNTPLESTTLSGSIISGAIALTFINLLAPLIICGINNSFSKVYIDEEKIKLTKEQKKELEPIYDEALKYLQFKGNPVTLAILATSGIMIMNFFMIRNIEKRKLKESENKDK